MLTAGIDEAGRGCIFGPVFAAAVIWDDEITHKLLRDSKKLSAKQRNVVYDFVLDNAIDYGIASIDARIIDSVNILNATYTAMHSALDDLALDIDSILVDGNSFRYYTDKEDNIVPHMCVVSGDSIHKSIMAASILAKVSHDRYVDDQSPKYPEYHLSSNKGYCTQQHIDAVRVYGRTTDHRQTFRLPYEKRFVL